MKVAAKRLFLVPLNGKQGKCGHTCIFFVFHLAAETQKNACWGSPQTRVTSEQFVPKFSSGSALFCHALISALW